MASNSHNGSSARAPHARSNDRDASAAILRGPPVKVAYVAVAEIRPRRSHAAADGLNASDRRPLPAGDLLEPRPQRPVDRHFFEEHRVWSDPPTRDVVERSVHDERLVGFAVSGSGVRSGIGFSVLADGGAARTSLALMRAPPGKASSFSATSRRPTTARAHLRARNCSRRPTRGSAARRRRPPSPASGGTARASRSQRWCLT